jgi:hypothetical protein
MLNKTNLKCSVEENTGRGSQGAFRQTELIVLQTASRKETVTLTL